MDIDAARAALLAALTSTASGEPNFRDARAVLIERGIEALRIPTRPGLTLDEIIRTADQAPATDARRAFAVLLVYSLGVPGLLPARGPTAAAVQSFLERVLLNPLRRAGYPFEGTSYEKRQALGRLHLTINEHLQPLQPSIPHWIHEIGKPDPA